MNERISRWLKDALASEQMQRDGFDSIDAAELLQEEYPDNAIDQLHIALKLYEELVSQYAPYSEDLRADLILSLEYTESLVFHSPEDLFESKVPLRQPPELYISKRRALPLFVRPEEEYRKVFDQNKVHTSKGLIYSYYTCKYEYDSYTPSYRFEHYDSKSATV